MIGSTETVPAEPGGGVWVVEARPLVGERVLPLPLYAVLLADGGVVWSTDGERATTWLTKNRAAVVVGQGRRSGDVWGLGVGRVRIIRRGEAIALGRISRAGALREL